MSRVWRWLVGLIVLLGAARRRRREERYQRIVEQQPASPRAELVVIGLLVLSALFAATFIAFFAWDGFGAQTQLMGIGLGGCFVALAAALIVAAKTIVPDEELEENYPEPGHPEEQQEIDQIVRESGNRITRKGLLGVTAGGALATIGAALIAPIASFGPFLETHELQQSPWKRGRRLVDSHGRPFKASDVLDGAFYTAYPEGRVKKELVGSPIIMVRLDPSSLHLPPGRRGWAPQGIVAYSKICTHAACAVSEYRNPLFPAVEPRPAFVCPCHYSTFDPARGAEVIFGPAGRPLPQLPLRVDRQGFLRANGTLSAGPGPAWWGVRSSRSKPA